MGGYTKIHQNPPKSTKIHPPRSTKIQYLRSRFQWEIWDLRDDSSHLTKHRLGGGEIPPSWVGNTTQQKRPSGETEVLNPNKITGFLTVSWAKMSQHWGLQDDQTPTATWRKEPNRCASAWAKTSTAPSVRSRTCAMRAMALCRPWKWWIFPMTMKNRWRRSGNFWITIFKEPWWALKGWVGSCWMLDVGWNQMVSSSLEDHSWIASWCFFQGSQWSVGWGFFEWDRSSSPLVFRSDFSHQARWRFASNNGQIQQFVLGSSWNLSISTSPFFPCRRIFCRMFPDLSAIFQPFFSHFSAIFPDLQPFSRNFVERSRAQGLGLRVPETICRRAGHKTLGRGIQSHGHARRKEPGRRIYHQWGYDIYIYMYIYILLYYIDILI